MRSSERHGGMDRDGRDGEVSDETFSCGRIIKLQ